MKPSVLTLLLLFAALGATAQPDDPATDTLEWEAYARKNYLHLAVAGTDYTPWFGIPPRVLRALVEYDQDSGISGHELEVYIKDQAGFYEKLQTSLAMCDPGEPAFQRAATLLREGKLPELDQWIDLHFSDFQKQPACHNYIFGLSKEMLLQPDTAGFGFATALAKAPDSFQYGLTFLENALEVGRYDVALAYCEKLLMDNTSCKPLLFYTIGCIHLQQFQQEKAVLFFEKALAAYAAQTGAPDRGVAACYRQLGTMRLIKCEPEPAIAFFQKAIAADSLVYGPIHPKMAAHYANMGIAYAQKEDTGTALRQFEKAFGIDTLFFAKNHPKIAEHYYQMGGSYIIETPRRAIALMEKALDIVLSIPGYENQTTANYFDGLGTACFENGDLERAILLYEKSLEISGEFSEPETPVYAYTAVKLARVCEERGMEFFDKKDYTAAAPHFQKGLENAEKAGDLYFSLVCIEHLGHAYKLIDRHSAGLAILEKGIARADQLSKPDNKEKPAIFPGQAGDVPVASLARQMRFHQIECLIGVGRTKEARNLTKKLYRDAKEANDAKLLAEINTKHWVLTD